MPPVIIATDFSHASDNAMFYGAALASRLNSGIVLINVYNFPVVPTSESAVMVMPYEEFHDISEEGLKKSKRKLLEKFPDLVIETRSVVGEVVDMINQETENPGPLLVVIGSRNRKESGILFGSTTTAIVKNCIHPLLSVPEHFTPAVPHIAVLATDLSPISDAVMEKLKLIVSAFQLELHLVHVVEEDRGESHEELMKSVASVAADFKTVISDDLSDGIERYTRELGADLVITLPHAHSWLEGLFMKKHTKELVTELHVPLLCIPE